MALNAAWTLTSSASCGRCTIKDRGSACCIAPVILAKLFGDLGVEVTIGQGEAEHAEVEKPEPNTSNSAFKVFTGMRNGVITTRPTWKPNGSPISRPESTSSSVEFDGSLNSFGGRSAQL